MKPKGETVLSSEEVLKSRVFKVRRSKVKMESGRESTFDVVEHNGAAIVLPILPDGSILFIKQWRRAVNSELLEIVAGTLEVGEDPLECAKRELIEETHHTASDWIPLGKLFPAPGFCNEVQHGFLARGLTPQKGTPDEDEIIENYPMKPAEVKAAIIDGRITDGKSLAFLLRAMELGLIKI